ncbi:MAG: hypothetical protein ACK53L_04470, partial [Pirellulaceae bacterium]
SVRRGQRWTPRRCRSRQPSGQIVAREMLSGSQHEHEALAVAPTRGNYAVTHPPGQAGAAAASGFRPPLEPAMRADT